MKTQLPVSRSTRNSTIAGPSHSSARSSFNDASASAGSRVSAIAMAATPPVAGASFNRRCWKAATHSPLCSSISTPTPTPGQYSCSKTGPGSFIRSASDNISRVGMQRACDGHKYARGSAQNQHRPVFRIACHQICGARACLRFLLLICLHQCHGSFSGGLFIVNAFHLPCLACPNGPDQPHGINAQTDQKLTYQLEIVVGDEPMPHQQQNRDERHRER